MSRIQLLAASPRGCALVSRYRKWHTPVLVWEDHASRLVCFGSVVLLVMLVMKSFLLKGWRSPGTVPVVRQPKRTLTFLLMHVDADLVPD
jgi:hypothetical protein